jgi:hypothetical protein
MNTALPEDYYLTNFRYLLNGVSELYSDLMSADELHFLQAFSELSEDAQKLYVRMLSRRGDWFRADKLNYTEIDNLHAAAQQLRNAGLLANEGIALSELLPLFSKVEWLALMETLADIDLPALKRLKREALNEALTERLQGGELAQCLQVDIWQVLQQQHFITFRLLFFGNLYQDMTDFILRDLGLNQYESYSIDQQTRQFGHREQLDKHKHYYELAEQMEEVLAGDTDTLLDFSARLQIEGDDDPVLSRRVQRLRLTLARQLERLQANDAALALYRQCQRPPSRERQARLLVKAGDFGAAIKLCETILAQPVNEEEAEFADSFAARNAQKAGVEWPKPVSYQPPLQHIKVAPHDQGVEWAAAEYLAEKEDGDCYYLENTLFNGVFGLLHWQVIFAPVRGAFTHPFQYRPHDLYESDFLHLRHEWLFDWTLGEQAFADRLWQNWRDKFGIANPFVSWQLLDEDLLRLALERIPYAHWQAISERIWRDVKANRSGFPDLILFPHRGAYELVEVKGPGDRLQKNQQRWMQYFADHDMPHRVLHLEWKN